MAKNMTWMIDQEAKKKTLLKGAKELNISIKAPCSGKGKCGKCIVKLEGENIPKPTKQEEKLLKKEELKDGIRLACEVKMEEGLKVKPLAVKEKKEKKKRKA